PLSAQDDEGMKYANAVDAKAAYEENRPTIPTYPTDTTDDVLIRMCLRRMMTKKRMVNLQPKGKNEEKEPKRKGKSIAVEF
ncbi:Hypothetical protein FKW44_014251, partial [Caligus rogercresseyi]